MLRMVAPRHPFGDTVLPPQVQNTEIDLWARELAGQPRRASSLDAIG